LLNFFYLFFFIENKKMIKFTYCFLIKKIEIGVIMLITNLL
jgi:hypothetical protein